MVVMNIAVSVRAGIRPDPETGSFLVYCPALDLYSAGTDVDSAADAMRDAARLYLEECWTHGQPEALLRRRRFRLDDDHTRLAEAREAELASMQDAEFTTIVDLDVVLSLIGERIPPYDGRVPDSPGHAQAARRTDRL